MSKRCAVRTRDRSWFSRASRPGPAIGVFLQRWLGVVLLLLVGLAAAYFSFPSQQYDLDTLAELRRINDLDATSSDPAHMLYVVVGVPCYKLWLLLGYTGDALRAMQVVNAFCGTVAIATLALILRQLGIRRAVAAPVAVTAGLSYAFWTHTEDAFFIIPAACFALIAWDRLALRVGPCRCTVPDAVCSHRTCSVAEPYPRCGFLSGEPIARPSSGGVQLVRSETMEALGWGVAVYCSVDGLASRRHLALSGNTFC
jgi:hypothetical protein